MMATRIPPSSSKAFVLIRKILNMEWIDIPIQFRGAGSPGNTLEWLCNVVENNLDSPDLMDWEIKFHGGNSLLTLFHKTPQPEGVMNRLVDEFGWVDKFDRLSFRHTIRGASNKGFRVVSENDKIIILHDRIHGLGPYWEHNVILNQIGAKLRRLILVHGRRDSKANKVIYDKAMAYWDLDLLGVCNAIEKGTIYIDFDVRTTKGRGSSLRDHGTKFRIHIRDIGEIYQSCQEIK